MKISNIKQIMEKKIFEVLTIFLMCLTIIKSEEFKTEHRCQHPAQDEGRVDGGHEDERSMEAGYIDESLNAFDQEDPILIEEIRKTLLISPPQPDVAYNLSSEILSSGQVNQVRHLVDLFGRQRKGFFIEAGAYDGEMISNTLYLEKKMGWTGLLVEPNPDVFAQLVNKGRRAHLFGHCLSTKTTPETVLFDASGLLGGIIHNGKKMTTGDEFKGFQSIKNLAVHQRTIRIQCFPLYSILMALGNPRVDLFSLDVEGSEFKILQNIPWNKVNIRALLVEVEHLGKLFEGSLIDLEDFLASKQYKLHKSIEMDNIYIRTDFAVGP